MAEPPVVPSLSPHKVRLLPQHEIEIRVRYQETDPMGFLHHANYFTFFEMGRTELFRASGGDYRQMEEEGLLVVVVRAECRYQRPARYDDVLRLRTSIARITPAKIEYDYHLYRGEELLAVGHTVLAMVNRQGEVQPVPEWMQTA
jgi:acyl-CoA thioester hydrolase